MTKLTKLSWLAGATALVALIPGLAFAQDTAPPASGQDEIKYVFNTLLFLIGGFLVMWMAAGFAMLEAGMVRSKNVAMQCTKNIAIYSIAGLAFWLVGYNLVYPGDTGWFVQDYVGKFLPFSLPTDPAADNANPYASGSDWFFQMVFCGTAASIVSGTVAERTKIWPFVIFVAILCGLIYPIQCSWKWGAGWLDDMGFADFAGSTLVHSVGGWAALTGALVVGARKDKFGPNGQVNPMPGSSMPLATLGMFILWLGWFGFNGASQLAMGTIADASSVANIFVNTNMAAAAGAIAAMIVTQIFYGKVDLTMIINGALAGLVSITAEPLAPAIWQSVSIGAIGGIIVVLTVPLLDKLQIDDVVGAIPVHLFAGIWGTLIVAWTSTNENVSIVTQSIGVVSIGAFVVATSSLVWIALAATVGLRPSEEEEIQGLDKSEIGLEAYPEFGSGSQRF